MSSFNTHLINFVKKKLKNFNITQPFGNLKRISFTIQFLQVLNFYKPVLLLLLFAYCIAPRNALANHLMGGDISYRFISISGNLATYELKATFYRDCNGGPNAAQLSPTYSFGIYNAVSNALVSVVNIPQVSLEQLSNFAPNCPYPPGICVQEGIYISQITVPTNLPNNPGFWVSLYTRVRNTSILNVSTANFPPNFDGMVWACYIPPASFQNHSPSFLAKPVPFMCNGREFRFNHVGFDPDGDSLVFKLAWPFSGPGVGFQNGNLVAGVPGGVPNNTPPAGTSPYPPLQGCNPQTSQWFGPANYQFPYSFPSRQLPTNPVFDGLTIDPNTGEVVLSPTANGNFVVAVEVQEFRVDRLNDTAYYLGSIRRDLQFIIGSNQNCFVNQPPVITTPADEYTINVGQTLSFNITATDPNVGDSVRIDRSGIIFDASAGLTPPYAVMNPVAGFQTATTNFTWTPNCSKARVAPYSFVITAVDNNCNVSSKTIFVKVNPRPILNPQPIQCIQQLSNDSLRIQWVQNNNASFSRYRIYRSVNNGPFVLYDSITTNTQTTYIDTNAINASNVIYKYRISIVNNCNEEGNLSSEIENIRVQHTLVNASAVSLRWNRARRTVGNATFSIGRDNGDGVLVLQNPGLLDTNGIVGACNGNIRYTVFEDIPGAACSSSGFSSWLFLIDTVAPTNPALAFATVENGQVRLRFRTSSSPDAVTHLINRGSGTAALTSFSTLNGLAVADSAIFIDQQANPQLGTFRYQLQARDSCGNLSGHSQIHQPVWLQGNNSGHLQSSLNWTTYQGFAVANYLVQRLIGTTWSTIASLPATDTQFVDLSNQFCGVGIQYRILTLQQSAPAAPYASVSNVVTIVPVDTIPPSAPLITGATVLSNNSISIQFQQPLSNDVGRYDLFVSVNGGNFNFVGSIGGSGPFEFVHSGINTRNNTFCYQIRAVDTCNTNIFSAFSVTHCPIRLQGTAGQLSNNLFWRPYVGSLVRYHFVEQQIGSNWVILDSISGSDTTYTHNNLACNRPVTYRISSVLTNNFVSRSSTLQLIPFDTVPPAPATVLNVSISGNGQLIVTLNPSTSVDVNLHTIAANGALGSFNSLNQRLRQPIDSITFNNLTTNNQSFCVNASANDSCSSLSTTSNTLCTAFLTATAGNLSVSLQWQLFNGWPITLQEVQRFNTFTNIWETVATFGPLVTSFVDSINVVCNVSNNYRLLTRHQFGNSFSNEASAVPFDNIAPQAPMLRSVSVVDAQNVQVIWAPSPSTDVNRYRIFFGVSGQPLTLIDSVSANVFSYVHQVNDASIEQYCYQIVAVDSCGYNASLPTAIHCNSTLSASRIGCERAIRLSWNPYSFWGNNLLSYQIWGGEQGQIPSLQGTVPPNQTFFDLNNLAINNSYCYRILAINQNGLDSSFTAFKCLALESPLPPIMEVSSVVTSNANTGAVKISWRKVSANLKPQSLTLYHASQNGQFSVLLSNISPNDTVFNHQGINTIDSINRYYIEYIDSCGNLSTPSEVHNTIELSLAGGQIIHTLNWNPYLADSVIRYEIITYNTSNPVFFDSVPGNQTTYNVYPAPCNFDVYYIIRAVLRNGAIAWSDSAVIRAIDTIPALPPTLVNASVTSNNRVTLDYIGSASSDLFGYAIYRSTDTAPFVSLNLVTNANPLAILQYIDTVNTLQGYHCYTILVLDSCLNATASDTFCVMQLMGDAQNLQNALRWKPFKGYPLQAQEVELLQSGTWQTLAAILPTDTAFLHLSLPCNVPFSYRIKGIGFDPFQITYSDTVTLFPFDTIPPDAPTLLLVNVINNASVGFKWQPSTAGDLGGYRIWAFPVGGVPRLIGSTSLVDSFTFTGLFMADSNYTFGIEAFDTCATNLSAMSNLQMPVWLQGRPGHYRNFLSWNTYQTFSNATQILQRFEAGNWLDLSVLSTNTVDFIDSNLICNQQYLYRIQTTNLSNGLLSWSNTLLLAPFDSIPPIAPVILQSSVLANQQVQLSFLPSISLDVFYYKIEASINGSTFDSIGTVSNSVAAQAYFFTHTGSRADRNAYCYRIIAVDTCGLLQSSPSAIHCPAQLSATAGNLTVNLNWIPYVGFPVQQYYIERTVLGGAFAIIDSVLGNVNTYVDTKDIACNVEYIYRLRIIELGGNLQIANSDSARAVPFNINPPESTSIWAVSVSSNNTIDITWKPSNTLTVNRFAIWRIDSAGNATRVVNNLADTAFVDNVVNAFTSKYSYYVIAIDSCSNNNESLPSDTVTTSLVYLRTGTCDPATVINWDSYPYFKNGVQSYIIERSVDGGGFSPLVTLPSGTNQYFDTGLDLNSSYCYRVVILGFTPSERLFSGVSCAIPATFPLPNAIDVTRATVTKTGFNNGEVTLNWLPPSLSDTLIRAVRVFHSINGIQGSYSQIANIQNLQQTQFVHGGINTATQNNFYKIAFIDSCGRLSDTAMVYRVINLSVSNTNLSANLNWNRFEGYPIANYKIEKSINGFSFDSLTILNSMDTAFSDTLLSCGLRYFYRVVGIPIDTNKLTTFSDTVSVIAFDTIAPPQSSIVRAHVSFSSTTLGQIILNWDAGFDRNLMGFNIERTINNGPPAIITILGTAPGRYQFIDGNLNTLKDVHAYRIQAFDSCGNLGVFSAQVKPIQLEVTAVSAANLLSITTYDGPINGPYIINRRTPATPWINLDTLAFGLQNYIDSLVQCDSIYIYQVFANIPNTLGLQPAGSDTSAVLSFDLQPPVSPNLNSVSVRITAQRGVVDLNWQASSSRDVANYRIYHRNSASNWQSIALVNGTSFSHGSVNTVNEINEYRIEAIDSCRNIAISPSLTHATILLTTTPGNESVTLNFTAYQGWQVANYRILRDGVPVGIIPGNQNTFVDTNLLCTQTYRYVVEAIGQNGEGPSTSNESFVRPFDNNPPISPTLKLATANTPLADTVITITWDDSPSFDAKSYRVRFNNPISGLQGLILSSAQGIAFDTLRIFNAPRCYQVEVVDFCGNVSLPSQKACIIYLTASAKVSSNSLRFTPYEGFSQGVGGYRIIQLLPNGQEIVLENLTANASTWEHQNPPLDEFEICYFVEAFDVSGAIVSRSNITCVKPEARFEMPNAFSPFSSNGVNDLFGPIGSYFVSMELTIWDRWGNKVFYSNQKDKLWNGRTTAGQELMQGVYVYEVTVTDINNKVMKRSGTVTLIR